MNASQHTPGQQARLRAVFEAVGVKGEYARVASRLLRQTPEYERARREGRARDWLARESWSLAESLYEATLTRLESLES